MNNNLQHIVASTTFACSNKFDLKRNLQKSGYSNAPSYDLLEVAKTAIEGKTDEEKAAAILLLNSGSIFWFADPSKEVCKEIVSYLKQLKASDFIVTEDLDYEPIAYVSFSLKEGENARFGISWMDKLEPNLDILGRVAVQAPVVEEEEGGEPEGDSGEPEGGEPEGDSGEPEGGEPEGGV